MRRFAIAMLAALAGVVFVALIGSLFGYSPALIFPLLVRGSVGSPFAAEATVVKTIPLLMTGLAVVAAFRAGVWNIGAEGQFITGALAALIAAPAGSAVALFAAACAGAAWASIASLMRVWRNAPEVLTTILLNFIALHLLGFSVNGPLREAAGRYPQTDTAAAALPVVGRLHGGVLIALVASVALWFFLYRTAGGLRLRAAGHSPSAAQWAGIRVNLEIVRAMAISGALAGLAGGIELLGVTHRLFERFASGYGYSGIAVALLADLHPLGTLASAAFFGALITGAGELQRSAGIASTIATVGQATVMLILLLFARRPRD